MSNEFDYSDPKSDNNWIRINNPYSNRIEYYTWEDFYMSVMNGRPVLEIYQVYPPVYGGEGVLEVP